MNPNDFFNQTESQFDKEFDKALHTGYKAAKRSTTYVGLVMIASIVFNIAALFAFVYFIFWCCRHFGIIGN